MAVQDLWHSPKGARTRCPDCRSLQGPATARHGTGKRWRVIVPGHPSRAFTVKADAQQWERELWQQPTGGPSGQHVEDLIALWLDGKRHVTPTAFRADVVIPAAERAGIHDFTTHDLRRPAFHEVGRRLAVPADLQILPLLGGGLETTKPPLPHHEAGAVLLGQGPGLLWTVGLQFTPPSTGLRPRPGRGGRRCRW